MATGACNFVAGEGGQENPATWMHQSIVLARKNYLCYECGRSIPKATRYERTAAKWDHDVETIHTCLDCSAIAQGLSDGCREFGSLWEEISDYLFPDMNTACLEKIAEPSAKAYLLERWQKWKGL